MCIRDTITKGLGLHPRLITILEGESLVNDASGLIAYKYALAAILAGNFVLWEAGLNFLIVAIAGIAIGLAVAYLIYCLLYTSDDADERSSVDLGGRRIIKKKSLAAPRRPEKTSVASNETHA